ncbi:hypothetical protein [Paenibacillus faecalis]|uniref:hypothetical protein n=1 Tax=Paenibacillus faecalis TaxID=2079532 RepID=UPI000D103537|nr:hypothetical protein [Paenibacillus faecalis]
MPSHYHYHHRNRSSNQRSVSEVPSESPYPGVNSYANFSEEVGSSVPYSDTSQSSFTPYDGATETGGNYPIPVSSIAPAPTNNGSSTGGLGGLLSGLNLGNVDLKGIIDKMGGIDGIIANVGKVQKMVQGFQQLAPIMSLFAGMFSKKNKSGSSDTSAGYKNSSYGYTPKRRRRPTKRRSRSRKSSSARRKRRRS